MDNQSSIAMPVFMRTKQLAELLSVSESWLRIMRCEGRGPKFIKSGKAKNSRVLYKAVDVDEWMKTWTTHEPTVDQNVEAANVGL